MFDDANDADAVADGDDHNSSNDGDDGQDAGEDPSGKHNLGFDKEDGNDEAIQARYEAKMLSERHPPCEQSPSFHAITPLRFEPKRRSSSVGDNTACQFMLEHANHQKCSSGTFDRICVANREPKQKQKTTYYSTTSEATSRDKHDY